MNPRLIYADITGYGDNDPTLTFRDLTSPLSGRALGCCRLTRDSAARLRFLPPAAETTRQRSAFTELLLLLSIGGTHWKSGYVTTSCLRREYGPVRCTFKPRSPERTLPVARPQESAECHFQCLQHLDDQWFLIVVQNKDCRVSQRQLAAELLLDARFNDDAKRVANAAALQRYWIRSLLRKHWTLRHAFDQAQHHLRASSGAHRSNDRPAILRMT